MDTDSFILSVSLVYLSTSTVKAQDAIVAMDLNDFTQTNLDPSFIFFQNHCRGNQANPDHPPNSDQYHLYKKVKQGAVFCCHIKGFRCEVLQKRLLLALPFCGNDTDRTQEGDRNLPGFLHFNALQIEYMCKLTSLLLLI